MKYFPVFVSLCFVLAGCASTGTDDAASDPDEGQASAPAAARPHRDPGVPRKMGTVTADITDVLGKKLAARVDLFNADGEFYAFEVPEGEAVGEVPEGKYRVLVYVYSDNIPVLAYTKVITVEAGKDSYVLVSLLEGATPGTPLWRFDTDFDMAIDRVEMELGTDPRNARDVPARAQVPIKDKVISTAPGWYRGELHAHSVYHQAPDGKSTNTVKQLVQRAEKQGLDFLAITDRNTLESINDPDYHSEKTILIPAMEWGDEERGLALIYCPFTVPELARNQFEAQATARMVQAQGGVFVVAQPCFPNAPWRWGLGYANGIEVWCRDFRGVPPLSLQAIAPGYDKRKDGPLTDSIALAASLSALSANGQAEQFWNYELQKGLKASVYGGSSSSTSSVPIASPVTYVYAREKSLSGIVNGMWSGVTFVSSGVNGPRIYMTADVNFVESTGTNAVATIDAVMGGTIPLNAKTRLYVTVPNGKGKRLEILENGRTIVSKLIDTDDYNHIIDVSPASYSVYRARVVDTPTEKGFGPLEVLALTSPIYAQEMYVETNNVSIQDMWIRLKNEYDDLPIGTPELDPASREPYTIKPDMVFD